MSESSNSGLGQFGEGVTIGGTIENIHVAGESKESKDITIEYIRSLQASRDEIFYVMKTEIEELRNSNRQLLHATNQLKDEIQRLRDVIHPSFVADGIDEIKDEINHYNLIRKELIRRLRSLEIEQARKGIDTPPHIETQINDLRRQIAESEARIKILSYDLSHKNNIGEKDLP